jgi:2-iminoacetate synthase
MKAEFEHLHRLGFRSVLLLTGESPLEAGADYLVEAIQLAKTFFTEVSLEIFPATEEEYSQFVLAGATGLTIYQETYDQTRYAQVHSVGRKRDYRWRYEAPERALKAGFRKLGMGVLLGLSNWESDVSALTEHLTTLMKRYWQAEFSVSFPRLRHTPTDFQPQVVVDDDTFKQIIYSTRIQFPQIGLVLSTRESAELRDALIGAGITHISAGSKTNPGGYQQLESEKQFEVDDARSLAEIIAMLKKKGYDPVLKDWDENF